MYIFTYLTIYLYSYLLSMYMNIMQKCTYIYRYILFKRILNLSIFQSIINIFMYLCLSTNLSKPNLQSNSLIVIEDDRF